MRASYSGTAQRARLFPLQPLIHTLFAKYVPALQPQNIDASERVTPARFFHLHSVTLVHYLQPNRR